MFFKAAIGVILAIVTVPFIKQFVWPLSTGSKHNHEAHQPDRCRRVERDSVGSEDFQITSSGLAFITSGLTFPGMSPNYEAYAKSKGQGRIEILDLKTPYSSAAKPKELNILHGEDFDRAEFRPHGLSVLEDKVKSEHLIYVVNHDKNEVERIEKFRYLPGTRELKHLKSFYSDLFIFINDLTLVEEDRFYVSNFMDSHDPSFNDYNNIQRGSVVFFDGSYAVTVLESLLGPNGVLLSNDRRFLYVNLFFKKAVAVYERHSDLDLRQVQEVTIHTAPDNSHLGSQEGDIWVGCQVNAEESRAHLINPELKASSEVLRLPLKDGLIVENEITQEFYDKGDLISGTTIGGEFQDKMLVGSIIDSLVMCQRRPQ